MRYLVLAFFLSLSTSMPLIGQVWEPVKSGDQITRRTVPGPSPQSIGFYRLIDFPDNLREGDIIHIPGPSGEIIPVTLSHSPVLEPALQEQFPQIRAYALQSQILSGRLSQDPMGIDVVFTIGPRRYALEHHGDQIYELYAISGIANSSTTQMTELGQCLTPTSLMASPIPQNPVHTRRASQVSLRTYELAISVTSTYSAQHGGTTESVLAEINRVFNRVNEVFLRELALRFQIIEESTQLFFHEKANDPYTEGNNTLLLNTLDEQLVRNIGRTNYDLGHLLATNCGPGTAGVSAGVGTICEFDKGKALSCDLTNNLEEYVRVLTHELGHQLGAAHTWSNCPGINNTQRASGSAYEPGSGSSIMSYINSCGNQNLRHLPGPFYFHAGSIQQMVRYMEIGPGSSCVTTEEIANEAPEIVSVNIPTGEELYIPIGTPFVLTAEATDQEGDPLTYAWDQLNTGPIAPLGEPIQSGPSIRSFAPDTSATRYVPRLASLTTRDSDPEEVLPTYNRDLTFGLTVRDNNPNGGGIAQETVSFKSTTTAGPFFIDFPNDTSDQLFAGSLTKIQWNVAGTHTGLVNAPYVVIKMSTDGGKTFPITLIEQTENDGEEDVQLPNIASDSVRFMIQGYDHIFFDISDQNIPIRLPDQPTFGLQITPGKQIVCLPDVAHVSVTSFPVLGFDEDLEYSVDNPYPDVDVQLTDSLTAINESIQLTFAVPEAFDSDTLRFKLHAYSALTDTISRDISLVVVNNNHAALTLQYPNDEIQDAEVVPYFEWTPSPNADYYNLEVSTSASFDPEFIVLSEPNITADSFPSSVVLDEGEIYFWRVLPQNKCQINTDVPVAAFQTKMQDCRIFAAEDLPIGLGASAPGEIVSSIDVNENFEISDVNVLQLRGFHESVNQLKLILQKDTHQNILYQGECGIRSFDIDISFDDESVAQTDCRLSAGNRVRPLEPLSVFQGIESQGTWNVRWQDSTIGAGGIFQDWMLELCGAVRFEPLTVNIDTLYVAPGSQNPITKDQIHISNASDVTYEWVDSTKYGRLLKNGMPLRPGQKWTQSDLSSGMIQYKNESEIDMEYITLSAETSDGRWSGIVRIPVRLDAMVSVRNPDLSGKILVYPNPAREYLTIQVRPEVQISRVEIRNIQGQELYRYQPDAKSEAWTIPTSTWPTGMVIVSVYTDRDVWTDKIVIQR